MNNKKSKYWVTERTAWVMTVILILFKALEVIVISWWIVFLPLMLIYFVPTLALLIMASMTLAFFCIGFIGATGVFIVDSFNKNKRT